MRRYRFEAVLGALLLALFFAVSSWQSAAKLTAAEVERHIGVLEKQLPQALEDRVEFISRLRAWGLSDDGRPVYMLELMRFHDGLRSLPGGPSKGTPAEANAYYEEAATPLLLKGGGYPVVAGDTMRNLMVYRKGLDNWDRLVVVRYPGRRSFLALLSDPDYLKVMPYKLAALEVVVTPVAGELAVPDPRWIMGGALLAAFLLAGWVRAERRRSP